MNIERPSRIGFRSIVPWSFSLSAICRSSTRPRSGCASSRPRNRTVIFSLSPSSRNFDADLIFVSMSWSSIFGVTRTSFHVTDFCLFLASFASCCFSKRYLPKSRTFATGGTAFGAISTRSYPRSWACASARAVGKTPSCSPLGPMRRTAGTRICSLTRSSGAAIGLTPRSGEGRLWRCELQLRQGYHRARRLSSRARTSGHSLRTIPYTTLVRIRPS